MVVTNRPVGGSNREPRPGVYIYVTWLTRYLTGDALCLFQAWLLSHYTNVDKVPSDFNLTVWSMNHSELLGSEVALLSAQDWDTIYTEDRNKFTLKGSSGAVLGGKPDIVALRGEDEVMVVEVKTGQQRESDAVQLMIYMWALPRIDKAYAGRTITGRLVYKDFEVDVPAEAIDEVFERRLMELLQRLASNEAPEALPGPNECRFCKLSSRECSNRWIEDEDEGGLAMVANF